METVNIACFCQFLSDESHYWLKLAQNKEANNMLTHNLVEFQLITVNNQSLYYQLRLMSAKCPQMLPIIKFNCLFYGYVSVY